MKNICFSFNLHRLVLVNCAHFNLRFLFLDFLGVETDDVFCCCSPSAYSLCIVRCFSFKGWLWTFPWSSYQLEVCTFPCWPLSSTTLFCPQNYCSLNVIIRCKLQRLLYIKMPDQQLQITRIRPVWQQNLGIESVLARYYALYCCRILADWRLEQLCDWERV